MCCEQYTSGGSIHPFSEHQALIFLTGSRTCVGAETHGRPTDFFNILLLLSSVNSLFTLPHCCYDQLLHNDL